MITEFLLNIIFQFVSGILEPLPDMSWSVDTSGWEIFFDVVEVVAYMLPWDTVAAIVSLIITITIFRIIVSIIKTIWDILPLV